MSKQIKTIGNFLGLLEGVRQSGDGYIARCPAHEDHNPSLSIKEAGGKILLHCFTGCRTEDIAGALGLEMSDLFLKKAPQLSEDIQAITCNKDCYSVTPPANQIQNSVTAPVLSAVTGVTRDEIAINKCLSSDYLKSLGIIDCKRNGQSTIQIPYLDEKGHLMGTRFRLTLDSKSGGQRFAWEKGDHVQLYGLDRLEMAKQQGWLLLVEGESDCWTLWYYKLPALGIPGKSVWQKEWAEYFTGLEIYLWQEPDAEDLTLRLLKDIPELKVIKPPEGIKDISEAQIQGKDIPSLLDELKKAARSGQKIKEELNNKEAGEYYRKAKAVIESDDPLKAVEEEIKRLGYGGDIKPALVSYLAATSRLLAMRSGTMPVHLLLTGPSSSGKSYTLSIVKQLLPPNAYHEIDAGSPRILIYDTTPLTHKLLIFGEADSMPSDNDNTAASALRNLLQDQRLHYSVVVRDERTGKFCVKEVDKPGPTVLITTSTKNLQHQLSTRLFTLEMSDSAEQIKSGLKAQARLEESGAILPSESLVAMQGYFQLRVPIKVIVPFAKPLACAMGAKHPTPRMNRDFSRILSLIKAVTILNTHHRTNEAGAFVADVQDYATVRGLINNLYVSTTGASEEVRSVVKAVADLSNVISNKPITGTKLANHLGINKMAVSRRTRKAIYEGWLVNKEQKKGHPADYGLGEPMPREEGLPTVEEVSSNNVTGGNNISDIVPDFKDEECNTITPIEAQKQA